MEANCCNLGDQTTCISCQKGRNELTEITQALMNIILSPFIVVGDCDEIAIDRHQERY